MDRYRDLLPYPHYSYLIAIIIPIFSLGIVSCNPTLHSPPSSTLLAAPAIPPLIEATLAGDVEQVRSHLRSGTDPNVVHNTNTALTYAARDGFTEIAHLLVDADAEVNWIDGENVTPLILASLKGHSDIVQLLLHHGADQTVVDQWNRTALDYALRRGEADPIVKQLKMAKP